MENTEFIKHGSSITHEAIQGALIILLDEMPFEDITITKLTAKAGVSRQAFYRNYKNKEEVLLECNQFIITIIKDALVRIHTDTNPLDSFIQAFHAIDRQKKIVYLLIKQNLAKTIVDNYIYIFSDFYPKHTKTNYYKTIGLLSAILTITYYWIENGSKENPEYMANLCYNLYLNNKY